MSDPFLPSVCLKARVQHLDATSEKELASVGCNDWMVMFLHHHLSYCGIVSTMVAAVVNFPT
jgi:hypothetical protein